MEAAAHSHDDRHEESAHGFARSERMPEALHSVVAADDQADG
jgi:hypothetical protein